MILAAALGEPEGPVALADGSWLVVEMAADRGCVTRLDADGTGRRPLAHTGRPNGLAVDARGNVWIAESHRAAVLVLTPDGDLATRVTSTPDTSLRFPNDLAFGPDGALYLTDSGITTDEFFVDGDIRADFAAAPYDGRVLRIDPDGLEVTILDTGIRFANGLAFDAAGDLFVNETMTGMVFRYRLSRSATTRENFANVLDPSVSTRYRGPDGMAFDTEGRLYCAVFGQGDVTVLGPDGRVIDRLPTHGSRPTNVAFAHNGAPRLVVTEVEHGALEVHDVPAGGLPLWAGQGSRYR